MSMPAGEQQLYDACKQYVALCDGREPGLATWARALWAAIDRIHAITSEAKGVA